MVDAGDVPVTPYDIAEACQQIQNHAADILAGGDRRIVSIGGDHTIALPNLRALHAEHGPVALVHFDAHLDTWNTYFNAPVTHGTIFRRAFEEGLLIEDHSIHVGIRGPIYDRMDLDDDARMGFKIIRPATWTSSASTRRSTRCAVGSPMSRCICPSTSTCSIRRSPRAPAPPNPVV